MAVLFLLLKNIQYLLFSLSKFFSLLLVPLALSEIKVMFPQTLPLKFFKAGSCVLSNARHKTSMLTFTRMLILHIEKVRFSFVSHKNALYNASCLHHTRSFNRIQLHVKKVKCKAGACLKIHVAVLSVGKIGLFS